MPVSQHRYDVFTGREKVGYLVTHRLRRVVYDRGAHCRRMNSKMTTAFTRIKFLPKKNASFAVPFLAGPRALPQSQRCTPVTKGRAGLEDVAFFVCVNDPYPDPKIKMRPMGDYSARDAPVPRVLREYSRIIFEEEDASVTDSDECEPQSPATGQAVVRGTPKSRIAAACPRERRQVMGLDEHHWQ